MRRMNYPCDFIPWRRIHGLTFPLQKTTKKGWQGIEELVERSAGFGDHKF